MFAVGASKDPVSKVVVLPDAAFGILMVVGGVLVAAGAFAFMLSFLIDRIEHAVSQIAYGILIQSISALMPARAILMVFTPCTHDILVTTCQIFS